MFGLRLSGGAPRVSPWIRVARVAGATALALGGLSFAWAVPAAAPAAALTVVPGRVVGWGYNASHQIDIPAEAQSGVTRVAGGCNHSLALKGGKVIAWGDNTFLQTSVPAAAQSGVTAISAGCEFSLALKSDGTIVAWGDDSVGQTDVPSLLAGYKWFAIGAGNRSSIGLASNGTSQLLFRWGNGPGVIASPPLVSDGESAQDAYVLLKKDGTVQVNGTSPASLLTPPVGLTSVTAIDAGWTHALALKSNGTVVAWGDNGDGQTAVPAGLSGVTVIAAGGYPSLALKSNGTVVAWGRNDRGQATVPAAPAGLRYSYVAGGVLHSLGIVSPGVPGAPTGATATAYDGAASISWHAPASDGGSPITGYTVTSTPDGKHCTTTGALTCSIGGLANGTGYVFTVKATNAAGTGPASTASPMVTPQAAATAPPTPAPTDESTPGATASGSASGSAHPSASPSPGGSGGGGGLDPMLAVVLGVAIGLGVALLAALAFLLGRRGRNKETVAAATLPPPPPDEPLPAAKATRRPRTPKGPPGGDTWDGPSAF